MPSEIQWKKLSQKGASGDVDLPGGRSGHSLSFIGGYNYMLYGGISGNKGGNVGPNGDVYFMKMGSSEVTWSKEIPNGDERPLARSQHTAVTCGAKNDRVFVFGGHHDPKTRLNDTWFFNVKDMEWVRVGAEKDNITNAASKIGAPAPRANAAGINYENKIYLQGGHGGQSYSRIAFSDMYTFDLETETWDKIVPNAGTPIPDGRGGHSLFAFNGKIYIYGGWNSEQQYNNIWQFDLEKNEWFEPDINYGIPRWNHSSTLVPAIPTWKFFVFGGEQLEYNEGAPRRFGDYTNSSTYLDLGTIQWTTYATDPEVYSDIPSPREYASMAYDSRESRLLIFGGWNNIWFDDLYSLSVGKIVGPSYAITHSEPLLGQVSGGTKLRIQGQGFKEPNIKVTFTVGNLAVDSVSARITREVTAEYISETEIECLSPNFEDFGPKEAVMQVSCANGDLTTTWVPFHFFLNTRANKSLCYGPGILKDSVSGSDVEFIIQARNDMCENRQSGNDKFEVNITKFGPPKEEGGKPESIDVPCNILDRNDGSYNVKYCIEEECDVKIRVTFLDDKQNFVPVRGSPYSASFKAGGKPHDNTVIGSAMQKVIQKELERLQSSLSDSKKAIVTKDKDLKEVKTLLSVKSQVEETQNKTDIITLQIDQLEEALKTFQTAKIAKDSQIKALAKVNKDWIDLKKVAKETKKEITPLVQEEQDNNNAKIKKLEEDITQFTMEMKKREFFQYKCGVTVALEKLDGVFDELKSFEEQIEDYGDNASKFGQPDQIYKAIKDIDAIKITVHNMNVLWVHIQLCQESFKRFNSNKWIETQPFEMEDEVKKLMKTLKDMKVDKKANAYQGILEEIKKWLVFLPLIAELADPAMRDRHWDDLKQKVGQQFTIDDNLLLQDISALNLGKYQEDVEEITDQAKQEAKMEKTLAKIEKEWEVVEFDFAQHKDTPVHMIRLSEENFDMLEEYQVSVTAMFSSRYLATFETKIVYWQKSLADIADIIVIIGEVQRSWSFLENLFIHSDEVKKELPNESEKFKDIDVDVKTLLADGFKHKKALNFCIQEYVLPKLESIQDNLAICEKALNEFMYSKQVSFPRFFFVSSADLLDILSNGNNPSKVMIHMPKIISAMDTLELKEQSQSERPFAISMKACVGVETVKFTSDLQLLGKVEHYLQDVLNIMRSSLKDIARTSLKKFDELPKAEWLIRDPAQVTLLINLCSWVIECEKGFRNSASDPGAVRKAYNNQIDALKGLILMVQGDLTKPVRQKIMCLITMDAHSRDILNNLANLNVCRVDDFNWQTQLKGVFDGDKEDFVVRIADATLDYGYEYLGNGARLVITPLTDRIYVTATQALHLKMGCAPAGPAGTGKTESTKDLASALGKACYVFNCSDQMEYMGMAGIFKGLAASGSWGCFDEFNRLIPEVLSVCSVQFKAVCDAIKANLKRFSIQGDEVSLDVTAGAFITMNPGYLGRSELPEGLKALFRPITVVVPDLEMICENMLMAEGFQESKILAKKFTTLYFLCRDLLSKAAHYDWGLRAIKSVLVVAGAFKRAEPDLQEQAILMRALRDFNIPKIVADDLGIFHGLLTDLFPGINPPRKVDLDFENIIRAVTNDQKLYPDDEFILKVVQLSELLEIRHCVFVMGPPGAGKSSVWKTLAKAQDKKGNKTTLADLNPKVTSTDELYGVVLAATREWKDGLMSKTMRSLGSVPDKNPKWIILDGDLDANWIESMNSVMDDNKLLTLASNERIPLKAWMKMIFEIRDLRFATPATVSRAGILYISDSSGSQWRSYVKSWIARMKFDSQRKTDLQQLFDKYVPETLFHCAKSFKYVVPQVEISMVMSMCRLLENILTHQEVKGLEYIFVFACIWCIGGGYTWKEGKNYKQEFSNWWKDKWKVIKFQAKGTVFDYFVDTENSKLDDWNKMSSDDIISTIDTSKAIASYTIPTVDTISASYLMRNFIQANHSPMLVGLAGCGKTQIIKGLLNELVSKTEDYIQQAINFNFYTDANLLQMVMEQQLEKKAGKTFAPIGKYKLIYFVDDMNMPARDPYDTQNAIALLRQHRDYEHWYDKQKLALKDIKNTQLVAAMNPTAGSFIVNPRLQRHFWTLAVGMPEQSSLSTIYSAYLQKHFSKFPQSIIDQVPLVIKGTLSLHQEVERSFRKTAQNFHYEFNVRHLTNVFQGLLTAKIEAIKQPDNFVRLWVHEAERIYGDRLVDAANLATYKGISAELVSKQFSKFNLKKYFGPNAEPLIFAQFVGGLDDKLYDQFQNAEQLTLRLTEALREYNDTNAVMDLVLFEDAMKHVCKISRIIAAESGHALLVGVGGSGKQSLSALSCFICQFTKTSIMISSTYGMNDLKTDLQNMYMKSGVKDEGIMFLFTEGQITNERFLVYLNDLLSSGEIADLFAAEDVDGIVNNVRPAVKGEGMVDSKDNCWNFFIGRVKKNLHMALCFSPVGESLRGRARKFPALVTCTVIDWFHPWPEDALLSVAVKFLAEVDMASDEIRNGIEKYMPYSFKTVDEYSVKILDQERRYVYTTPKSFLELIKLFKVMLGQKEGELIEQKERYETGVIKLTETAEVVSKLEEELKIFSVEVEAKKKSADEQAEIVGAEKIKVEAQNDVALIEAAKCEDIAVRVSAQMKSVQHDLDQAIPLVEKALAALDGLQVDDFRMLKALKKPPPDIEKTFTCVLNILAGVDKGVPVDNKKRFKKGDSDANWKVALSLLGNPQKFKESLESLVAKVDADEIPGHNFKANDETLSEETFTPELITKKSACAGGLCDFVLNITAYYNVVISVEPKKLAVAEAKATLAEATQKKSEVDALVADLKEKLAILQEGYDKAMNEKETAMREAEKCELKLQLANRLVSALGSEQDRWAQAIIDKGNALEVIIGDVLLAASFVSYVGPFNKNFRDKILGDFVNFFKNNNIPLSQEANPLLVLTDEAQIAGWNNFGLPPDRVSTENGAILTNSERYSLIIDPQLQGITWIRKTFDSQGLKVTRLSNPKMVKTIEFSVEAGNPVLIENLENSIDAVIQPVYARCIIKKGKSRYIKMGDKELSLSPNFGLYMHTKLSNPHYPPEIQAECTLINFTVTESGLEDQLLALVVKNERPDLSAQSEDLIQQQNGFKIKLKELESGLLFKLANAEGDILEDIELIESLEFSKKLSMEIGEKVEIAKETEISIKIACEFYRPAASRGALVFFLLMELAKIHSFYKFSLDSFIIVVIRAIAIVADQMNPKKNKEKAEPVEGEEGAGAPVEGEEAPEEAPEEEEEEEAGEITPRTLSKRVEMLVESITYQGFNYTRRGTLERHKLIVSTMLTFRILIRHNLIKQNEVDALIKKEVALEPPHQQDSLKFIPEANWAAVKGLDCIKTFETLISSMESEALQWRKWYQEQEPEVVELPRAMKDISLFHRILLLRALRPDRLTNALTQFIRENMGSQYVDQVPFNIRDTYPETNVQTPIFFVLFPGVDPTPEVELIGEDNGKTIANGTFINISMGQGQEDYAIKTLKEAGKAGNWCMFQNVHLMQTWMKSFEKNFEEVVEDGPHPDFRCFISSEAPGLPLQEIIPEAVLQNSLKVANEAPTDLKSNIQKAFGKFGEDHFERSKSHKHTEFKALLFGLCMYHSLILGRKKFGSQGWSRPYPFNDGDLRICGEILHNYLGNYEQVPYSDLRYLYGEVMYGGHITDDWDRRTNNTYLQVLIQPKIMEEMNMTLAHGFRSPKADRFDRAAYLSYVDEKLPPEIPNMFGLHPNAEIGYLTTLGETLFSTILSCSGGSGGSGGSKRDLVASEMLVRFLGILPAEFNMIDLGARAKDRTPYVVVCLQECERMNLLTFTIRKSLEDLAAGLSGALNVTDEMEDLATSLFINKTPAPWVKYAYFSMKDLLGWWEDLLLRIQQLDEYSEEFIQPKSLWISGLFNPMSFLTAIMQVTSRQKGLALDDMTLKSDVTNTKDPHEISEVAEDGAYVHGFFLEGAGWELGRGTEQGYLTDMILKDLHPELPVMLVTAVTRAEMASVGMYKCPVYVTTMRGGTYTFTAFLKMESEESDEKLWILAGVALLMSAE